ncbi:universal stress protein [Actinomadura yumaensis]|uniref:universal stress protein n=1 Tax=Actinomadura yumaensis TaxID=111807 RepID=UPI00361E705C
MGRLPQGPGAGGRRAGRRPARRAEGAEAVPGPAGARPPGQRARPDRHRRGGARRPDRRRLGPARPPRPDRDRQHRRPAPARLARAGHARPARVRRGRPGPVRAPHRRVLAAPRRRRPAGLLGRDRRLARPARTARHAGAAPARPRRQVPGNAEDVVRRQLDRAERDLARAAEQAASLAGPGLEVRTETADGTGIAKALRSVDMLPGEVLACMSSHDGPLRKVFLGATSGKIVRASSCPVVVLPREPRNAAPPRVRRPRQGGGGRKRKAGGT